MAAAENQNDPLAGYKYKAFISYSHKDAAEAAWLHKTIEAFKPRKSLGDAVFPERLAPVFRDRDELPSAPDLSDIVERALDDSAYLIVVCSKHAAESPWVNQEVEYFKRARGEDRVLAYIVADEPNDCFPPALLNAYRADGTIDESRLIEPVAADRRASGDGRRNASLKVIAGLLGVGYDRVRNRDQQQRQRRLLQITTLSVIGFFVTAGLAIAAVLARMEADEQRDRAEVEAETAKRTSDFLVDIFQVASPSEARGETVTAAEILRRGTQRIQLLDGEPLIQSNLLHTMGEAHLGLGLYNDASGLLVRARDLRAALGGDVGASQAALAEAMMYAGRLDEGTAEIDQVLARIDGEPWSELHSHAFNVAGDIAVKRQKLADAEALYARALEEDSSVLESLEAPSAGDLGRLARSESGLATAIVYQQRFADAIPLFERSLENYQAAYGELHPQVAVTYSNLGLAHYFLQQWDEVMHYYGRAVPLAKRLLGEEHPEVAALLNNSGRVTLENGSVSAGAALLEQAIAIYEVSPGGEEGLLFALNSLGLARLATGDPETAVELQSRALELNLSSHRLHGPLLVNRTLALYEAGRADEARSLIDEADAMLRRDYAEGDWRFSWLRAVRARLDDRPDELIEAGDQLAAIKGDDNWFARTARKMAEAS